MADVVAFDQTPWKIELFEILEETFEHHHGHYLDKGTSLFETLRAIDSRQASVPVGAACAPLSAQVAHVTFYLEVLERAIFAGDEGKVDWDEIWRTVGVVTPEEWDALRDDLERAYRRVVAALRTVEAWVAERHFSGALSMVVHTAYHLGEIRQSLCAIGRP